MTDPRRSLPSVDRLLQDPAVVRLSDQAPRNVVVAATREILARARQDAALIPTNWGDEIALAVSRRTAPSLFPILNATGVVLHTNLGRAPLARAAIEAAVRVASSYSNLELDVATGARGSRLDHCASLLAERAGSEDAMVVNNAAGALVLALNAVASGREVIISRGELVEIGGSFRIPDIIGKSGAILREVGTTNRTHLADYRNALTEATGAILVVHRSNFEMSGFVASPSLGDLAGLAQKAGVPLVNDVGSGLLLDLSPWDLRDEPLVQTAAALADLVIFSGDKLLGGPQAGCLAGRGEWIARLRKNPFARALRTDKFTLAALEATLALYRDPLEAVREIPILAMLTADLKTLTARAERLAMSLAERWQVTIEPAVSAVGGGSFPGARLPTMAVAIDPGSMGAGALALSLRLGAPSILARVETGRVLLDPRTLPDDAVTPVAEAFAAVAP